MSTDAQEETLAAVPFTCRLTAAYRWIEHTRANEPVLLDPLAQHLAGSKALNLATDEWAALQADQGTNNHFRVPARSRIIDDVLQSLTSRAGSSSSTQLSPALHPCTSSINSSASSAGPPSAPAAEPEVAPAATTTSFTTSTPGASHPTPSAPPTSHPAPTTPQSPIQVVCLGAGMDTRPWRLRLGPHVHYFEVDHADVIRLKGTLLSSVGAQTSSSPTTTATTPTPTPTTTATTPTPTPTTTTTTNTNNNNPHPPTTIPAAPPCTYPLLCGTWATCGADLTSANLVQLLETAGFSRRIPTVWIAEGLLYYLPLPQCTAMLQAIAGMSARGSSLLATCIDRVLFETHKHAQHVFANLWHFCVHDLVAGGRLAGTPWVVTEPLKATSALLRERYGKEVYRPLVYQGHEEFLVAAL